MNLSRVGLRVGVAAAALVAAALASPAGAATSSDSPSASSPASSATSFHWTSSGPLISPKPDATHASLAVKDPSVVYVNGKYHVFMTTADGNGWGLAYTSFTDWSQAADAPITYLDRSGIGPGYRAAPEVFWFEPQKRWYLVFQDGQGGAYSTTTNIDDPLSWSPVGHFYAGGMPDIIKQNIGNGYWVDFFNTCDEKNCYLFSSDDNGHLYRSETTVEDFPNGYHNTTIALQDPNRFKLFEASNIYKIQRSGEYLLIVEAIGDDGRRMFRSWTSSSLTGQWKPLADTADNPFARSNNVTFDGTPWTQDISHGEVVRHHVNQEMIIDPCEPLQYLYQGLDPAANNPYGALPYRLGLLTAQGPNPVSAFCKADHE